MAAGCELEDEPRVVLAGRGVAVLMKPPDWEVNSGSTTSRDRVKQLSSFLAASASYRSVLRSPQHDHGFINRLDTPSSGLVLQATCYEGFYHMRIQRELGLLQRDYVVLCHGWMLRSRAVTARILRREGGSSQASSRGRPACTLLKVLAHLQHGNIPLSLLAVTILSGRTHQIRCHLKYIGHPVVSDARYGYPQDAEWCEHHFLHRYRVSFVDLDGHQRTADMPLPLRLRRVLSGLQVTRGVDAVALWSSGEGSQRSWQDWEDSAENTKRSIRELVALQSEPLELPWVDIGTVH
eukprot:TRINITY_DN23796_c0_g2_i1.p1 TRINITY_DN23796_c0_g2~~TRINITY_DN23796_c0_g2_i1.p1  ORF type:complete len:314 (-),score=29.51 TRINITY_DN23796_c0_g2_i1:347-1228(-)